MSNDQATGLNETFDMIKSVFGDLISPEQLEAIKADVAIEIAAVEAKIALQQAQSSQTPPRADPAPEGKTP